MFEEADILSHKARRMIYNYIYTHPGVSLGSIIKVIGLNKSTIRYHLQYLGKAEKITSKVENGKRHYYVEDQKKFLRDVSGINSSQLTEKQKQLHFLIKNNPGISVQKLAKITKIKKSSVSYNIKKLQDLNQIWKIRNGNEVGYELLNKDLAKDEMSKLLVKDFLDGKIDEKTYLKLRKKLSEI